MLDVQNGGRISSTDVRQPSTMCLQTAFLACIGVGSAACMAYGHALKGLSDCLDGADEGGKDGRRTPQQPWKYRACLCWLRFFHTNRSKTATSIHRSGASRNPCRYHSATRSVGIATSDTKRHKRVVASMLTRCAGCMHA